MKTKIYCLFCMTLSLALFFGCAAKKDRHIMSSDVSKQPTAKMDEPKMEKEGKHHKKHKGSQMSIIEASIATSVVDLVPQGVGDSFKTDVQKVYCYTKINNSGEDSIIHHVWMHDGQEMANVKLNTRAGHFRTYSSKNIEPHWTGKWEVIIKDANGNTIKEIPFQVKGTEVSGN